MFKKEKKEKTSVSKNPETMTKMQIIKWLFHFVTKVILYSILVIFLGLMTIVAFYFVDQVRNIGKNQGPLFNAYVIISPSMHPTIKVQDAILIKRKTIDEIKKGDIITYISNDPRYSGLTVTHRAVSIQKTAENKILVTTKGDNNNTEDASFVTEDNLIGKVILKIPKIGYFQSFLLNIYGWIIIIVIPCVAVICYDLVRLFKTVKKKPEEIKKNKEEAKKEHIEVIDVKEKEKPEELEVLDIEEPKEEDIEVLEEEKNEE